MDFIGAALLFKIFRFRKVWQLEGSDHGGAIRRSNQHGWVSAFNRRIGRPTGWLLGPAPSDATNHTEEVSQRVCEKA